MKKVNTEKIVSAYNVLVDAKITKMDDADKFKVIKALKELKAVATDFEDFRTDARKKLEGEGHEEMIRKAQQWQAEGEKTTLTEEERVAVNKYLVGYNSKVAECVAEEAGKEHELDFEALTEDAFVKLLGSNDWTARQIMEVEEVLM